MSLTVVVPSCLPLMIENMPAEPLRVSNVTGIKTCSPCMREGVGFEDMHVEKLY